MSGWLRKIFGGGKESPDGAGIALDEPLRAALKEDLAHFDRNEPGLGARALRYVLTGADEDVLTRLAASPELGSGFRLKVCADSSERKPPVLFQTPIGDPLYYVRLGKVYEAASRQTTRWLELATEPGLPAWLEILLWEASTLTFRNQVGPELVWLGHEQIEAILRAAGEPDDRVLRAFLCAPVRFSWIRPALLLAIPGLPEAVARHPAVVREALQQSAAAARVQAIERLLVGGCSPVPFVDLLAAPESAQTVRAAADAWLATAAEALLPTLRALVTTGAPAQQARAVALVWRLGGPSERAFLAQQRATATDDEVRAALDGVLLQPAATPQPSAGVAAPAAAAGSEVTAPATAIAVSAAATPRSSSPATATAAPDEGDTPPPERPVAPLGANVRQLLADIAARWHAALSQKMPTFQPTPPSPEAIDEWMQLLQAPSLTLSRMKWLRWKPNVLGLGFAWEKAFQPLLSLPELSLGHVVRLACLLGMIRQDVRRADQLWIAGLFELVKGYQRLRGDPSIGLLEVAEEASAVDVEPARIGTDFVFAYSRPTGWSAAEISPYFLRHPELLESALGYRALMTGVSAWFKKEARLNALSILAQMPTPPGSLHAPLWGIALGSVKAERPLAQAALARLDGITPRILAALGDSAQAAREAAAQWLAELGDPQAVPALKAALKKEKKERSKATLMEALESLGVSLDEFLDRPTLNKEAQKGLAKGVPEALGWFPFDRLPSPHWSDDGQPLAPAVMTWWIVQANKLGTPEPGPLLRRYALQLVRAEAEALGKRVLEFWIAEDTALPSEAEAAAKVAQLGWGGPSALSQVLQTPRGSAIAHKGLLAVTAAMGGEAVAPLVARYLKDWYGLRAAQCKALLQMLSWIEHPSAIQVLLQTATRFRTPGIRALAEECVQDVAQRRGWTLDELADRTVPTGGLDDTGRLTLSYGARTFQARLGDDFKVTLENEDGKAIAGLPEPRADDDATLAAEAKQLFSAVKKQVKTVVKQQEERLYEAMCVQRRWPFADWQTYVAAHPIVGRLAQRVVWMVVHEAGRADQAVVAFRPLGDGTLTGADDSAVAVAPDATIGIAHPLWLPAAAVGAWQQHLADYEIEPLLEQFGRPPYSLPEALRTLTELDEFEGHLVASQKLRGRATKRGYVRGQAEDGGWFFRYRRNFPSLGLAAELNFSGNSLPEENRTVALTTLQFLRTTGADGSDGGAQAATLADVPAVLVSECWNDLREIAAEGSGHDPDWQTKVNA